MHIACLDFWRAPLDALLRMSCIKCIEQVVHNLCESFCPRAVLKFRDASLTIDFQANCSAAAEGLQIQLRVTNELLSAAMQVEITRKYVGITAYLCGESHVHFLQIAWLDTGLG